MNKYKRKNRWKSVWIFFYECMDFCIPCIRLDNQLFRIRKAQKTQFQPNMSMDFLDLIYPLPLMGHLIKTAYYSVYAISAHLNRDIKRDSLNNSFYMYHLDKIQFLCIFWNPYISNELFEDSLMKRLIRYLNWDERRVRSLVFFQIISIASDQFEIQLPESPLHESSPSLPPAHNWVGINLSPVTLYNSLHRSKLKPSTSTLSLISLFDAVNRYGF